MPDLQRCLSVRELARRWRCRVSTVRRMLKTGLLAGIVIDGRTRILPEAIASAEQGALAVRPAPRRRRRDRIDPEIEEILR